MKEGDRLKQFIENQPKSKISIARELDISKQTLFQYFKSKELSKEVKDRFEDYFGKKIFDKVSMTNTDQSTDDSADKESFRSLSKAIESLSSDKERTTTLIEKMFDFIERNFNSGTTGKVPSTQTSTGVPGADQVFGDLGLDKSYQKDNKDIVKKKDT